MMSFLAIFVTTHTSRVTAAPVDEIAVGHGAVGEQRRERLRRTQGTPQDGRRVSSYQFF